MVRKWSNLNLPGALHFVTGNFINRTPGFNRELVCEVFLQALMHLNREWPAKLIAYVLMPDHLHFICNPRDGRIREFTGALKGLSAKRIAEAIGSDCFARVQTDADGSKNQVWQESFKGVPLWSDWMIWQKINYIHANPVKAGLCKSARDYKWSSFRAFHFGINEPISLDEEWSWPDDAEKFTAAMKEMGWRTWEKRPVDGEEG